MSNALEADDIGHRIFLIRGHKVMLDSDLANLYGVETKALNRAVRRNIERFPGDFVFDLTEEERLNLRCQIGTSSSGHGGRRYVLTAFTEQGIAMLSSVLRSPRAIQVNIAIMRAFVRLRETLSLHKELAAQLRELERKVVGHDARIQEIFAVIKRLMAGPQKPPPKIGFRPR